MKKPRSRAIINPTSAQMIPRHIGRIKRLREAIEKAKARQHAHRIVSLQAELDRRLAEIAIIKADLDDI